MTATVLLLTDSNSLVVALTLHGSWNVVTKWAPDAPPPDVMVVDDDGLRSLEGQVGGPVDRARTIVISDREIGPADVKRVARPYPLADLLTAVTSVLQDTLVTAGMVGPETPGTDPVLVTGVARSIAPAEPDEPRGGAPTVTVSQPSTSQDGRVRAELGAASASARRLVELLGRMPSLASPQHLAPLIALEVADALRVPTVGFWRATDEQHHTFLGGVGLTVGEQRVVLSPRHPVVADALERGGVALSDSGAGADGRTGLPAARHPALLAMPLRETPIGNLLAVVGGPALMPEAFDAIEAIVESCEDALHLCGWLERLTQELGAT